MALSKYPPSDLEPSDLFRRLLLCPRPKYQIRQHIEDRQYTFDVWAINGLELACILGNKKPDQPLTQTIGECSQLIVKCLYSGTVQVFKDTAELGLLRDLEFIQLAENVIDALNHCSPTYNHSDIGAWATQLSIGAAHETNLATTYMLSDCFDVNMRGKTMRPDRYFGLPYSQMTDGQWMAYNAACKVVANRQG